MSDKIKPIIMSGKVVHPLGPGQIKPFTTAKGISEQWEEIDLNEEPEKDTYWMITKANRDNLIKMGVPQKRLEGPPQITF